MGAGGSLAFGIHRKGGDSPLGAGLRDRINAAGCSPALRRQASAFGSFSLYKSNTVIGESCVHLGGADHV